jgi:hypothetical protein
MEKRMVVWVQRHVVGVVLFGNVARVDGAREVEEEIGEEDGNGDSDFGEQS